MEMKEVVTNVDLMARTIAANTQEIAAGAEEQAAISETMSASAEETSSMAESLNEMVSHFKVLERPLRKIDSQPSTGLGLRWSCRNSTQKNNYIRVETIGYILSSSPLSKKG